MVFYIYLQNSLNQVKLLFFNLIQYLMNPTLSTLQKAEKEITVDFPIEKVKEAIMTLFNKFPSKYMLRKNDINEAFNTYHFPISNGLNPVIVDMSLEKVSDDKTKISISVTNAYGAVSSNSILAGQLSDYLLVLGKVLSGESVEDIKETVKNSGCMLLLLVGLSSLMLMSFVLF